MFSLNLFVLKEMKKIATSEKYPKNMALASAWAIAHFKGVNIKIFDVAKISSLCDYNIIASAENTTQARSMASAISAGLKEEGHSMISLEGLSDGEWILLDMGDIIIHIFQENARDVYDLDSLWIDYPIAPIPAEYYISSNIRRPEDEEEKSSLKNYF